MNPPPLTIERDPHCPAIERIAVLEAEKIHTEKAIAKMDKELEQISEAVSRVEIENRDIKRMVGEQGTRLEEIAKKLDGGASGTGKVSGLVAGGNLERLVALGGGLALSLGWSLLFLALVGVLNKPVALQIVQWVFKILGVVI